MARKIFIDIAKGMGIILVIIGHHDVSQEVFDWIYSFHMPLFFIISGYLWHSRSLGDEIRSCLLRLIGPLYITKLFWFALLLMAYLYKGSYTGPNPIDWILGGVFEFGSFQMIVSWFLWALFWARIWMFFIFKTNENVRLLIALLLFGSAIVINSTGFELPFKIVQGMTVPVFMIMGYYMNECELFENHYFKHVIPIFFAALILSYQMPIHMGCIIYPHCFWNIISSTLASVGVLYIAYWLSSLNGKSKLIIALQFMGRNSLAILMVHSL